MTRYPFGSTSITRAERTVVRVVCLEVVPAPLREVLEFAVRRLARLPAAFSGPAAEVMEALALDVRPVLVVPVATAEACSLTMIVTTSSTLRARTSAAISAKGVGPAQREPGLSDNAAAALRCASSTYSSSADFCACCFLWDLSASK